MIHYVYAGERYALGEKPFSEFWARIPGALRDRIQLVRLQDGVPAPGTWIFAGAELLRSNKKALELEAALRADLARYRVFNSPRASLTRLELSETLYAAGINRFSSYSLHDAARPWSYPIFLRHADRHHGSATPVLPTVRQLDEALQDTRLRAEDMLVVEYLDTRGDDGLFRKYSVMRIGDLYFPRHVLFSENWVTKSEDVVTNVTMAEESAFLDAPVRPEIRAAFELARIDYGRIDYAMLDGKPQIWEINSDPTLVPAERRLHPGRRVGQGRSAEWIIEALAVYNGE